MVLLGQHYLVYRLVLTLASLLQTLVSFVFSERQVYTRKRMTCLKFVDILKYSPVFVMRRHAFKLYKMYLHS